MGLGVLLYNCNATHIEQTLPQPKDRNFIYASNERMNCFYITPGVKKCIKQDGTTITIIES